VTAEFEPDSTIHSPQNSHDMARRKRPLTFVPAALFLSTGVVTSVGALFYSTTHRATAHVLRLPVARRDPAATAAAPPSLGSCEVPEK